jgi:hypothetical protein
MIMIGYLGEKNGIILYRLCGTKEKIYEEIGNFRYNGYKFFSTPIVNHVHRGQWTCLLQLISPQAS